MKEGSRAHEARVWVVTVFLMLLFAGLIGRLCAIQAVDAPRYRALAAAQHQARVPLATRRGSILDRQGRELALSVRVPSVFADPQEVPDPEETARRLGEMLGLDAKALADRLERPRGVVCLKRDLTAEEQKQLGEALAAGPLADGVRVTDGAVFARPAEIKEPDAAAKDLARLLALDGEEILQQLRSARDFVWVKRHVTEAERGRVMDADGLAGVGVVYEYKRTYPNGELAAQLTGFAGIDENGLEGLELALDRTLSGTPGYATFCRDAAGHCIAAAGLPRKEPVPGADVELTLDSVIQGFAEAALKDAWELWGPKAASAVVLDPRTGDILAAACLPIYDPNRYGEYEPKDLKERARGRYFADWMEPGSIMKPFVLSGALSEGLVTEDTVFFCENGVWVIGSRRFHDHHAYGNLSAADVIVKSSNVGAAKIGTKLGAQKLYQYLHNFGFGQPTGIPLPGENPGMLRPPSRWTSFTVPSVSIGQEICVSILQMTSAYATIANDGVRIRPRLIRRTLHSDGRVEEHPPKVACRVIPAGVAQRVRRILFRVVEEGTGKQARVELYSIGGKTGTAQKATGGAFSHSKLSCSFVGMAPIERPRVVVMVMLDEPTRYTGGTHFGGTVAAPVVGRIINQTLAYLGVTPDKAQTLARLGMTEAQERAIR